jgi:aminoglycoside 6'-N-acetyltransferase I
MIKDIIDLNIENEKYLNQTADLLLTCFEGSWSTIREAIDEVKESIDEHRLSRIAVDYQDNVIGWIGGIAKYDGNVWELHPLVVRKDWNDLGK